MKRGLKRALLAAGLYIGLPYLLVQAGNLGLVREGKRARREVALTARRITPGRLVTQIHFGGGTPTFFPPEQLARLGLLIYENFQVDPDCEFSCEIDPRRPLHSCNFRARHPEGKVVRHGATPYQLDVAWASRDSR